MPLSGRLACGAPWEGCTWRCHEVWHVVLSGKVACGAVMKCDMWCSQGGWHGALS